MINYIEKDITTVESGIVAHGCNCSGGFGTGVAGAIKKKWPIVEQKFRRMPSGKEMLGAVHVISIDEKLAVANMYTQLNYGYDGKRYADVNAIDECIEFITSYCNSMEVTDLYLPKIGAKRGGLDWDTEVLPIINKYAQQFPELTINICIYDG